METTVLWRRLSATDFAAINGKASPRGHGGGAMHIALGVRSTKFPIDEFLGAPGQTTATISAAAGQDRQQLQSLTFSGNPGRRGGEWRIHDQYSHRHPAWSIKSGFPSKYDSNNPPYILLFKVGKSFHARYCLEGNIIAMKPDTIPIGITSNGTGIRSASQLFTKAFSIPRNTMFDEFDIQKDKAKSVLFDPKNMEDGRKRIIASVIRRLGQRAFRQKLISAYKGRCAVTGCNALWVLEAAHIVPYRGLKTNITPNGLLLRADVHTLFDLALVTVEPAKLVVRVSKKLEGSWYESLDGESLRLPANKALRPSSAALEYHYEVFQP